MIQLFHQDSDAGCDCVFIANEIIFAMAVSNLLFLFLPFLSLGRTDYLSTGVVLLMMPMIPMLTSSSIVV